MLPTIPNPIILKIIEDPPYEIKGIGTPVRGMILLIAATLTKNCIPIQLMTPVEIIFPKTSCDLIEIIKPLYKKNKKTVVKTNVPINPNSSPIIANIESEATSGRYWYFCLDLPNPSPEKPPEPKAIEI